MITSHAAVPRWGAQPPLVDESGTSYGIVGTDRAVTRGWVRRLTALGRPWWQAGADELAEALVDATVGLRVLVAGPEEEVLAVAAQCRAAGLTDSELTLYATSAAQRRVYCAHCRTTSLVPVAVDEVAPCSNCERVLLVFAHASARTGSYLGFQADAEEL